MSVVDTEQLLLIGGEWVPASGGGTAEKTHPYTGEPVGRAAAVVVVVVPPQQRFD
jgi:acyl-CoA reductase-like NAD-dependent aldehyde dehydrogenase